VGEGLSTRPSLRVIMFIMASILLTLARDPSISENFEKIDLVTEPVNKLLELPLASDQGGC
jgi:hypothetical protein